MAVHRGNPDSGSAPDILGLMRALDDMPARQVVVEWNSLQVSLYVYARNFQEITAFTAHLLSDESNEDIWHGQARRKMEQVHHETARLLQNHTAAVEALLEHTDKIHQRLYEPQLKMQAYVARKHELRSDPLVSFVKCLRNVLLHGETAKLAFRTEFTRQEVYRSLVLDRSFLDKHANWWKGSAKTYVRNVVDHVDIPRLLQDYHAAILGFMDWFVIEMMTVSKDDFDAFAEGERQLFLTQISHMLDCWLRNPDPTTQLAPGDRTLFSGLFDEEDFRILDESPIGSAERADKAIERLAARFDVPVELQNKLRLAYMDVNFFDSEALFGADPSSGKGERAPS